MAGCTTGPSSGVVTSVAAPVATPESADVRARLIPREAGLVGIIGEPAASLTQRFGMARIDLAEGDARKLQYVSGTCVLDIYLYPLAANADPVATHVETRARENGAATDRAQCIAEVEDAVEAQR
ncbi:hypothetical protein [Qipengyuania sp. ASV99]|uniref:hypothetical protein n=1 Tax=Qipengyuania sp. ASV99 TaxID=3399681 RepID=UPI003A4C788D